MIRFNCPTCGRPYELPDAMAHLPLVCKQCGQRLTPPAPTPDPPPPPPIPAAPPPAPAPVALPKPVAKPATVPKPPPAAGPPDDDDVLVSKPDSSPDIDFNIGGPTAASLSEAARARPAGLSDATRPRPTGLEATELGINLDQPLPTAPAGAEPVDRLQKINLDLLPPAPPPPPKPAPPPAPAAPPEARPEPTLVPFVADLAVFVLLVVAGMFVGELLARKPTGEVLSEAGSAAKFPPVELLLWAAPPVLFGLVYLLLGSRERSVGGWLRRRQAR